MSRIDLHVHVLMADALFFFRGRPGEEPSHGGRPGEERLARRPGDIFRNQVSFAGWRQGGFGIAVLALYSPPVLHRGRGHLREILRQAAKANAFAAAHAEHVAIAGSPDAARRIAGEGRTALVLAVEGGHGIAAPEDVGELHAAGVRMLTLAHLLDNAVAAAAVPRSPLESPNYFRPGREHLPGGFRNPRGLTPLGRDVVRAMQQRGMLIDLAHASDRAFDEVLALTASEATPLVVSHTASRALWPTERNLDDAGAAAIGERRGAIGVTLWRRLVAIDSREITSEAIPGELRHGVRHDGSGSRGADPTRLSGTSEAFAAHFRHLTAAAGGPRVALGSDLNGMVPRLRSSAACPCGVRHLEDWPSVERTLRQAGVPDHDLAHTADPFLEAWTGAAALGAHGPSAQAVRVY
jgi:membrane dipeptidase